MPPDIFLADIEVSRARYLSTACGKLFRRCGQGSARLRPPRRAARARRSRRRWARDAPGRPGCAGRSAVRRPLMARQQGWRPGRARPVRAPRLCAVRSLTFPQEAGMSWPLQTCGKRRSMTVGGRTTATDVPNAGSAVFRHPVTRQQGRRLDAPGLCRLHAGTLSPTRHASRPRAGNAARRLFHRPVTRPCPGIAKAPGRAYGGSILRAGCKSPPAVMAVFRTSPRAPRHARCRGSADPGAIPEPTVTVRMQENGSFFCRDGRRTDGPQGPSRGARGSRALMHIFRPVRADQGDDDASVPRYPGFFW